MQHATQGKLHAEIAYRSAQAQAAFNEARRKVFKSPGVPLVRKAFIFRASVLPKLLYGAGAWPPLNAREYRLWGFYRQLLCIPRGGDQHYSAATILALVQLPGPAVLLHVQRLLYLSQLLRTGPPTLWALLRQDRPYAEALQTSTRWLHSWVYNTSVLAAPDAHWQDWVHLCRQSPQRFKGLVLRAQALEGRRCKVVAGLEGLHRAISQRLPGQPQKPDQERKGLSADGSVDTWFIVLPVFARGAPSDHLRVPNQPQGLCATPDVGFRARYLR